MEFVSGDLLTLLTKLLPGFLAAAIFHALTAYPKRDIFDRIVTALIFTLVSGVLVLPLRELFFLMGREGIVLGDWTSETQLAWMTLFGASLGVGWAYAINHDCPHRLLRRLGVTKKTAIPTSWFSAFGIYDRFVILHFENGRRLMGWPREWPDEPGTGHFVLERPAWVLDDGQKVPMNQVEGMLVPSQGIELVEFLRFADDSTLQENHEIIEASNKKLAALHERSHK